MSFPLVLFLFFVLNRIFFIIKHLKFSSFLRFYSLWPNLVVLLVIQNLSMFVFLICHHFSHVFYFTFSSKIFQIISFMIITTVILSSVLFYFIIYIKYQDKTSIFIQGIRFKKGVLPLIILQLVIKPILQSVTNAIFYEYDEQLLILSSINLLLFVFVCAPEMKCRLYKKKIQFLTQTLTYFLISFTTL